MRRLFNMGKPEIEFIPFTNFEATPSPTVKGSSQRIIAQIPGTTIATRILQMEPGTNTSPDGIQTHDFWEELYILEGSLIDLRLHQEFTAGMVACRPPGMEHGPSVSPNGCKIFEVRYYADKINKEHEFVDFHNFEERLLPMWPVYPRECISADPSTGVATRILQFAPGTDTSPNGSKSMTSGKNSILLKVRLSI